MRHSRNAAVLEWLDQQPTDSALITSITLFETRFGLALLPAGRRRQVLEHAFDDLLREDLENRVLDSPNRWYRAGAARNTRDMKHATFCGSQDFHN